MRSVPKAYRNHHDGSNAAAVRRWDQRLRHSCCECGRPAVGGSSYRDRVAVQWRVRPRLETLAAELCRGLEDQLHVLADPFAPIHIVVPHGLKRWLIQRISLDLGAQSRSSNDGISAGITYLTPQQFTARRAAAQFPGWFAETLVWDIAGLLSTHPLEYPQLADYLAVVDPLERSRRLIHVARQCADLFRHYLLEAPDVITAWRFGSKKPLVALDGLGTRRHGSGVATDQPASSHPLAGLAWEWQHALFNQVDTILANTLPVSDPWADFTGPVHVFAPWDPPGSFAAALDELAERIPVQGWWWQPFAASAEPLAGSRSAHWNRHWEKIEQLLDVAPRTESGSVASEHSASPDAALRMGAIEVHNCATVGAQVDLVRDLVVGALEDDPELQPRDIAILSPRFDEFAPQLRAAFATADSRVPGNGGSHPGRRIPIAVAAVAHNGEDPAAVFDLVLNPKNARTTALDVVALCEHTAVRPRFGFTDEEITTLRRWISVSGYRWGLSSEALAEAGLSGVVHTSWADGLDRLVAAAAGGADRRIGSVPAAGEISSSDLDLLGRFLELHEAILDVRSAITPEAPVFHWAALITEISDRLLEIPEDSSRWARECERQLVMLRTRTEVVAVEQVLDELRKGISESFTPDVSGSGPVTIAPLGELALTPFRRVFLMGMDAGTFPSAPVESGDDLTGGPDRTRDELSRDRGLFAALLMQSEHVVLTYQGQDLVTGHDQPPASVVQDLLESSQVQSHHRRRFEPFATMEEQPIGASSPNRVHTAQPDPASRVKGKSPARAAHLPGAKNSRLSQDEPQAQIITVTQLAEALVHPLRAHLSGALKLELELGEEDVPVDLPVTSDGLSTWKLGEHALRQILRGETFADVIGRTLDGGQFPPGELAKGLIDKVRPVSWLANAALEARAGLPQRQLRPSWIETAAAGRGETGADHPVTAEPGFIVRGPIDDVHGSRIVRVTFSRMKPLALMRSWLELALDRTGSQPKLTGAILIFRHDEGIERVWLPSPSLQCATAELRRALRWWVIVQQQAIALPSVSAFTYARALSAELAAENEREDGLRVSDPSGAPAVARSTARRAARRTWEGEFGERSHDPSYALAFGGDLPFAHAEDSVLKRAFLPESMSLPSDEGPGGVVEDHHALDAHHLRNSHRSADDHSPLSTHGDPVVHSVEGNHVEGNHVEQTIPVEPELARKSDFEELAWWVWSPLLRRYRTAVANPDTVGDGVSSGADATAASAGEG